MDRSSNRLSDADSDSSRPDPLIPPCGGPLVDLWVPAAERDRVKAEAARLPSLQISDRALCDLTLLASGGFSPLDRFMGRADYERVLGEMRLAGGALFPLPITLQVPAGVALRFGSQVALRDAHNDLLAPVAGRPVERWVPFFEERWLPQLVEGGVNLQVLPVFVETRHLGEAALRLLTEPGLAFRLASAGYRECEAKYSGEANVLQWRTLYQSQVQQEQPAA